MVTARVSLGLVTASLAVALFGACHDQENPLPGGGAPLPVDSGGGSDGAPAGDTGSSDAGDAGGGRGSGTIAGSVTGKPFTSVATAYWIGVPDVATTTAVYVIGDPGVACADIAQSGWAHTIPAGIQIFEMIMATKSPAAGPYSVSTAATPPVGSAEVNYIFSAPARDETRATTGTITLSTLTQGASAVGSFDVQFPAPLDAGDAGDAGAANRLTGTFDAVFCAVGHEP